MRRLVIRVDDDLVAAIDELIATGFVDSRSEAVRLGLEDLVDRHRRKQIGAAIVQGYRTCPQAEAEMGWADAAAIQMIADEPW